MALVSSSGMMGAAAGGVGARVMALLALQDALDVLQTVQHQQTPAQELSVRPFGGIYHQCQHPLHR